MILENLLLKQQTNIPFLFLSPQSRSLERENESSYIIRSYIAWQEQSPQKVLSGNEIESIMSPIIIEPKSQGTLNEIFGLWKGRNISLDKIREQQWGRRIK